MDTNMADAPPASTGGGGDAVPAPAPKQLTEQQLADGLRQLRTDFRTAAIAHFSVLFLHHLGGTFNTDDFELDLLGVKPGAQVPALLGKILNTLANDRNCNSSNWLNALRRSYNRRVTDRSDNPFYSWQRVPASVVEAERELEAEREAGEAAVGSGQQQDDGDEASAAKKSTAYAKFAEEEQRLRDAEKALYRKKRQQKVSTAADAHLTEAAVDDGFNAELAEVINEDAEEAVTDVNEPVAQVGVAGDGVESEDVESDVKPDTKPADQSDDAKPEPKVDEEEEWYEEQRAVDWEDLSLKTKLDAIYNVCEWHMVDPERQFRKYLQWDGEAAWRLDPIGKDAAGNTYYHTADDRLWMQRPVPEASSSPADSTTPVRRPKTLLGLQAGPRDKSKKGTVTGVVRFKLRKDPKTGAFEQVADAASDAGGSVKGDGDEGEEAVKNEPEQEEERELEEWEREYWQERVRAETTPGFVEWEAVCINLDDWRSFADRFAASKNRDEVKLRNLIVNEIVPAIEEEASRRAVEREAELAEQERKRNTRSSTREEDRPTRSSTRTAPAVAGTPDAAAAAAAAAAKAAGESREERLRKREEEKRRHEEEEEKRLLAEAREREREEARAKNGGVLPVELMTAEERAAHEAELAQAAARDEAEQKKKAREEAKRARARERRAELKAERDAALKEEQEAAARAEAARAAQAAQAAQAVQSADDDSWYLDCEICGLAGWNYDDGQGLICCDQCEDWQHLPCHMHADELAGRPPQPYSDESFKWICGHCRGTCHRRPRPPKPAPGAPPTIAYARVDPSASHKRKGSHSSGSVAAKKVKPAPYGGHTQPAPPAPAPAPAPQPAQPQPAMSYEQLKAAVEANPALMQQLPPEYQAHFAQLLGLPIPS
ncbi:hypothetical protein JCM8115_006216 [Rhodotorula mucilaginosa]|uniref:PHD-type domain-containing protein n=1 Tax=Rhodotorula mucilaginosa TaxID=5537 RepID=A0A9P6W6L3_RHOMI|nr:hypothetical protein C6P46_001658 [Rhodotorula mucilaginosa]